MSYTSLTSVQALMARINQNAAFSSATAPTSTQITTMITDLSAEIDMTLASVGYTVPVTAAGTFLTYLGLVCQYGVVAEVLKAMFPESTANPNGGPVIPAWAFWEKRYQDALTKLGTRKIVDPTAPMSSDSLARSYLTDYPDNSGADGNDGFTGPAFGQGDQPVFAMGQEF